MANKLRKLEFSPDEIAALLPPRLCDAHKGDFGHVLVVGGDHGAGGAVRMAAEAALRVGAGLVAVATREQNLFIVNCGRPELMCFGVESAEKIVPLLSRATVIGIGPGLGFSAWGKQLFEATVGQSQPSIFDADALNLLSQEPRFLPNCISTPHPGEAARLLGCTSNEIQEDRHAAIVALQKRYGGVFVLKGAGTLVIDEERNTYVCQAGNPGMATAGMGDVLTGVIAGLLAQGLSLANAAKLGVFIHATAADLSAAKDGELGMLATDLMPYLRKSLRNSKN